jgi:lipopolysaccharide/colanic/teichoic acid biosynthesis glycosyltransferase
VARCVLAFGRDTLYPVQRMAKRAVDIVAALILLVLGSPLTVLYWLAAKLRGVPLYRTETRLGRDACPFELPVVHAGLRLPPSDLVNLPVWVAVLAGRMSLVGPWALPPSWNDSLLDWQRLRFEARPGVTGFWRTLGSEEFDRERVLRLDLYYVQNGSLGLDFRLLLRTASAMLRGHFPSAAA